MGRFLEEANQGIRDAIARAAKGEFVRWDTPLYASADGSVSIIIDASPDAGHRRPRARWCSLALEGATSPRRKRRSGRSPEKNIELQGLLERIRELDEIKTQFFAGCRPPAGAARPPASPREARRLRRRRNHAGGTRGIRRRLTGRRHHRDRRLSCGGAAHDRGHRRSEDRTAGVKGLVAHRPAWRRRGDGYPLADVSPVNSRSARSQSSMGLP